MRKGIVVSLLLGLLVSMVSAQSLIGGKGSGMGGAGVASSRDLSAAYYNPACLMRTEPVAVDIDIALGASYSDLTALQNALSKASDPALFLLDNYANNLNFNGNMTGVIGANIRKVGVSILPMATAYVNKPANSTAGTVTAQGLYGPVLTLGTTYSVPFLPAALDIGLNLKQIAGAKGDITAIVDPSDPLNKSTGTQKIQTASGTGFDFGLLTSFDVPMVTNFSAGIVMRNISTSYTWKGNQRNAYIDKTTGLVTLDAEVPMADQNVPVDSSTAIGVAATVPGIGLEIAADYEMTKTDSNTHIGVQYPLLLGMVLLRAGIASGPNLSLTTYGAEVDLKAVQISLTSVSDAKNTANTNSFASISIGF